MRDQGAADDERRRHVVSIDTAYLRIGDVVADEIIDPYNFTWALKLPWVVWIPEQCDDRVTVQANSSAFWSASSRVRSGFEGRGWRSRPPLSIQPTTCPADRHRCCLHVLPSRRLP